MRLCVVSQTGNLSGRITDMEEIARKGAFCTGDHIIVPNLGNWRLIGGGAYDKM